MRKIIFLFAILCIAGVAFGQKKLELLWEQQDSYSPNSNPYLSLAVTSAGKTVVTVLNGYVTYREGIRIYNAKGSELKPLSGKPLSIVELGEKITLASTNDSLYFLDKEFSLIKTIKGDMAGTSVLEVEDGFVFYSKKDVFKYDFKGDKLWQYTSSEKIEGAVNKTISVFKTEKGNYVYLDNKGRESIKISSKGAKGVGFGGGDMYVLKSVDLGFWLVGSKEIYKYDSTGTQSGYIDFDKEKIDSYPFLTFQGSVVSNDNYSGQGYSSDFIVVAQQKQDSLRFVKVDKFGKYQMATVKYNDDDTPETYMVDDNRVSFYNSQFIGVCNLREPSQSWIKQLSNTDQCYKYIDNTFVVLNNKSKEPITNRSKYSSVTLYDLSGQNKILFKGENVYYPITSNSKTHLYINHGLSFSKIKTFDGAIIWGKDKPIESNDYYHSFMTDSEGNDYWIYSKDYGVETKIDFISKSTNRTSRFFTYPKNYYPLHSSILIDSKSKTLITATNGEDNIYGSHIIRKYSTRCAYDLEATAQATGKTEVCSGTKIKLSTTKQDGLSYQWQKDGEDIPTFRDAVHDVEESGNYTVTVKDEVCQNQAVSNAIPVTIKPTPEAIISTDVKTVIYEPFTVKMTANTGTGLSYQWLKDDVIIPNETSNIYEAKKFGKYNVIVMKDGCQKTSEALNISIQIALSAESEINEEAVQVYPNPSRGAFKLILSKSLQSAEIQLFDLLGRERTLTYTGEEVQAEGLVQGTYFLKVTKGEKSVTNKIVVE
jgi:Secretion system C-terminal sorting domain